MLWMLVLTLCSFGVAWLRGGRLKEDFELRRYWLAPLTLGLQIANILWIPSAWQAVITVSSYALLLLFAHSNAHTHQGMRLVLAGMVLNLMVILVNSGRMPVDIEVARSVGVSVNELSEGGFAKWAVMRPDSRLPFLGDVIPIPAPVRRVISLGDIFVALGGFVLVQDLMGKRIMLLTRSEES